MATRLDTGALSQLFVEARTHRAWQPRDVPDDLLKELVDLMKMGPTASNCQPARLIFVKSKEAKERLKPHLSEGNREKTMAAPVCAIVGFDLKFYEHLPKGMQPLDGFAGKADRTTGCHFAQRLASRCLLHYGGAGARSGRRADVWLR